MWKNKDNILKMLLISIIIILIGVSVCKIEYTRTHQEHVREIAELKEYQWDFIVSCIEHYYDSALIRSNTVARLIEQDMGYIYNTSEAKLELQNNFSNQILPDEFYNILKKHTSTTYFNNVKTDENTLVVTKNNRVILGVDRTHGIVDLSNDLDSVNNAALFQDANDRINNAKTNTPIFIANSKGQSSTTVSEIDSLREDFMKNDIEIFRGYIFLAPNYIEENEDFFGVPDIDRNGQRHVNDKLTVIQRFNFYDQFVNNSTDLQTYEKLKTSEKLLIQQFNTTITHSATFMILVSIILVLIFGIIIFCTKREDARKNSLRNQ